MIKVVFETKEYPETLEECNNIKCEGCVIDLYNIQSEEECFHRALLVRGE